MSGRSDPPTEVVRLGGAGNPDQPPAFPGYTLLDRLGAGAHAVVYRARQDRMDRLVALKVLPPRAAGEPRLLARFLREAQILTRLAHEHIVSAYDRGEVAGHHYLAMEYVDGHTIEGLLERGGAMDERRAARVVWHVAQALAHLAEQGFVHRDIKPGNIVLNRRGIAKLCDLGFVGAVGEADEGEAGFTLGTPNYVSPEQARGMSDVDTRSDIYSLGATFYHMVTGEPPFAGRNAADIMAKHIAEPLVPPRARHPDVSEGVSYIVERMLAKAPADRYPTPEALARDVQEFVEGTFRVPQRRMSDSSLRLIKAKEALPLAEPVDDEPPTAPPVEPPRGPRRR